MEALSTYVSYLFDIFKQHEWFVQQFAQALTVFGFTFAIWKWWDALLERRRRERQAKKLAKYADAVFEDRTRAALGGSNEEEAPGSEAPPHRSRRDEQNIHLIAAFSSVLKSENRKNFWWGLLQNLAFFIIGLVAQPFANKIFP